MFHFFKLFCVSKNQKFLFSLGGFTFNKQVFFIKASFFFSKRGFSQNGWFYLKGVSFFQRGHFSKIFKGFLFFFLQKVFFLDGVFFSEVFFFFSFRGLFLFWKKSKFQTVFCFLGVFCFAEFFSKVFLSFFLSFFFLDGFLFFRVCFLLRKDLLKKNKITNKRGRGPLSPKKKSVLNTRFLSFMLIEKHFFQKKKLVFGLQKKAGSCKREVFLSHNLWVMRPTHPPRDETFILDRAAELKRRFPTAPSNCTTTLLYRAGWVGGLSKSTRTNVFAPKWQRTQSIHAC